MRSIFAKLAIATFVTLGLVTVDVQGRQIKNLVQHSASGASHQTNMMPINLAEVLISAGPAPTNPPPSNGPASKSGTASQPEPSKNSSGPSQALPAPGSSKTDAPAPATDKQKPESPKNGAAPTQGPNN